MKVAITTLHRRILIFFSKVQNEVLNTFNGHVVLQVDFLIRLEGPGNPTKCSSITNDRIFLGIPSPWG